MSNSPPSRVVYVGSIPYDQAEEQLLDVFRSVGNVANIRLVLDRETGKSKGFAFVEYHDVETAASAVRNLNNYQIGNRNLRVDFSHETTIGSNSGNNNNYSSSGSNSNNRNNHNSSSSFSTASKNSNGDSNNKRKNQLLPELPKGTAIPAGGNAAETITQKVSAMDQGQMLQIITDLKSVIHNNPAQARELFKECPQLAYAAVQSMLMLGIVQPNIITGLVEGNEPVAPAPEVEAQAPSQEQSNPQQQSEEPVDATQSALIRQVMQLTEDQIKALPQEQQDQIRILRQRVESGELAI